MAAAETRARIKLQALTETIEKRALRKETARFCLAQIN